MPRNRWSDKRERQYEHVKESELEQGRSKDRAEEIAARTVNKTRSEHGETRDANKGGRSDRGPTRDELYQRAREKGVQGRSRMNKAELARAVR